jgi:hypothetical protein
MSKEESEEEVDFSEESDQEELKEKKIEIFTWKDLDEIQKGIDCFGKYLNKKSEKRMDLIIINQILLENNTIKELRFEIWCPESYGLSLLQESLMKNRYIKIFDFYSKI